MVAEIELALAIELVLLAVLKPLQEAVAERCLGRDPGVGLRVRGIPASHEVGVVVVARELEETADALARNVSRGEIDGVVAFANVEGSAIDGDGFDDWRDEKVRIGIAVAVSVGREVVGIEEIADLKELGDGLAVVAGNTRRKVLRRFDSSGGGLDGKAGNGDGRSRPSRIRVQYLVVDDNALRGIGRHDRRRRGDNRDRLVDGRELLELQAHLLLLAWADGHVLDHGDERRRLSDQLVNTGIESVQSKTALLVAVSFADRSPGSVHQLYVRLRDRSALRI